MKRYVTALAALALIGGPLMSSASADTPLAFASGSYCDQSYYGPSPTIECFIYWSGGTGTVTTSAAPGTSTTFAVHINASSPGYFHVTAACTGNHPAGISATLADSTGASLSQSFGSACFIDNR